VFNTEVLLHVVAFILSPPAYGLNRGAELWTLLFESLVYLIDLSSPKLRGHRRPLLSLSLVIQVGGVKNTDFTTKLGPVKISSGACISIVPRAYHILN